MGSSTSRRRPGSCATFVQRALACQITTLPSHLGAKGVAERWVSSHRVRFYNLALRTAPTVRGRMQACRAPPIIPLQPKPVRRMLLRIPTMMMSHSPREYHVRGLVPLFVPHPVGDGPVPAWRIRTFRILGLNFVATS